MTTTAAATTATASGATSGAIDALLEAIAAGRGGTVAHLYADDAVLDATVPGWRFHVRGGAGIADQFQGWFADEGTFEELDRIPVGGGEIVTYLLTWVERGTPHAAHHCHQIKLGVDGRIVSDRFFCGGRWNATELARMAEADAASAD